MSGTSHAAGARHVNYVAIWGVLMVALGASLVLAYLEHAALAAALIYAIAVVKAALVAAYYMHLKFEPRFVVLSLIAGIACLFILFAGLLLDIVHVYGG
jgi:cytochrome c oxidase subunit 4